MADARWMVLMTHDGAYLAPHEDLPDGAALGARMIDLFTIDDVEDDGLSRPPPHMAMPLLRPDASVVAHSLVVHRRGYRCIPISTPGKASIKLAITGGVVAGRAFDGPHDLEILPDNKRNVWVTCMPACPDGEVAR